MAQDDVLMESLRDTVPSATDPPYVTMGYGELAKSAKALVSAHMIV